MREFDQLRDSLARIEDQLRTLGNQPSTTQPSTTQPSTTQPPAVQPPAVRETGKRQLRGFYDQKKVDEALAQHGDSFRRDLRQLMSSYRNNYWDYMPSSLDRMRDFEVQYQLNRVAKALKHGETLMGEYVNKSSPHSRVGEYSEEDTWKYILAGIGHRSHHQWWPSQNHAVWNLVFLWSYVGGVEVPMDF
ncbi:hypothetical protein IMZ48_31360 [Candidatus Bathyarchaeota archaeon]|nr:hypothetical protein [Candidatus Bathyarchaeota archaeon]